MELYAFLSYLSMGIFVFMILESEAKYRTDDTDGSDAHIRPGMLAFDIKKNGDFDKSTVLFIYRRGWYNAK